MSSSHISSAPSKGVDPIYDIVRSQGRIEGMVGQALTTLSDHSTRLKEHDTRIERLETSLSRTRGFVAGVVAVGSLALTTLSFLATQWSPFK